MDAADDQSAPIITRRMLITSAAVGGITSTLIPARVTAQQEGTEKWSFDGINDIQSSPTVVDGTVYVGSWETFDQGDLYAVNTDTGEEKWVFETGKGVYSSPTVVDGTVIFGSNDSNLYAVNADTGDQLWAFEADSAVRSSPTVVDGIVFVGSTDNNVYAVDAESGEQGWEFETGDWVDSSPTVANSTVFVGSHDENLYALNATSGEEQWVFETDGIIFSSPAVVDGTVFIGSGDGNLYAINSNTGESQWAFETGADVGSPIVKDGTVFVENGDGNIYAVNSTTGEQQWVFEINEGVTSPTVVDGILFIGSTEGNLYAVDANTGEQQWAFTTDGGIRHSPTVGNGTVFIGGFDKLYAVYAPNVETASADTSTRDSGISILTLIAAGVAIVVPVLGISLYRFVGVESIKTGITGFKWGETAILSVSKEHEAPDNPADSVSAPIDNRTTVKNTVEKAETAKSNDNISEAVNTYTEALNEYQAALDELNPEDTEQRTEIEQEIESTRADLEIVKKLHEQQSSVIEALQPAERSFQEGIVAYIENDQTVARIRMRQARDTFEEAQEAIGESEDDLLTEPVKVNIQPDRKLSSMKLGELPAIPEPAATELADAGIKTVNDLDSTDESPWTPAVVEELVADDTIDEDVATTLTMLSWWHSNEIYTFETIKTVEERQQQADYGFNHSS